MILITVFLIVRGGARGGKAKSWRGKNHRATLGTFRGRSASRSGGYRGASTPEREMKSSLMETPKLPFFASRILRRAFSSSRWHVSVINERVCLGFVGRVVESGRWWLSRRTCPPEREREGRGSSRPCKFRRSLSRNDRGRRAGTTSRINHRARRRIMISRLTRGDRERDERGGRIKRTASLCAG